jgi:orotate phosphoribosyltransferase
MSPDGLALIGSLGLKAIHDAGWDPDAVGGLTLGADPVSYAIAYASSSSPRPIKGFTVRKEAKGHGAGRLIEGPFEEGDHVVIIEDVITTGGSALRAVQALRNARATILGVFAVVDREEGGREAIEQEGLGVATLVRASEIVTKLDAVGAAELG